jgi:CHAD domain-containing protein
VAKAEDIAVDPTEPYRRAGARIVRVRADELFEQAEGVLDTRDIERVHDMRVASRRLRAVLEIFAPCFPPSEFDGVLRDVKRLADALGERRDPDVHIDALEQFAKALAPANRPGVAYLVDELRERQARANESLAAELERASHRGLHGRLLALADAADPAPGDAPATEAAAEATEVAEPADVAQAADVAEVAEAPDLPGTGGLEDAHEPPAAAPEWESAA